MLTPEQQAAVAATVKNLRIILMALVASVSAFLALIIFKNLGGEEGSSIRLIGFVFAAAAVVAAIVVPMVMLGQQRSLARKTTADDTDQAMTLLTGLQARSIIRGAVLEGAAMINAFAYMQERQPDSLIVSIALLLGIVITLPFRRSTEEWLERELRDLRDARQFQA